MSLDITLYYIIDGNNIEVYNRNITHNLNKMAMEAEVYEELWRPDEIDINKASELINPIAIALKDIKSNPDKYKKLNPENGWGTYEGFVKFVQEYLDACIKYPNAHIIADR